MKKAVYNADSGLDKYINPVLYTDVPDPDVIKSGDHFYMVSSSFNYTPGLPIWRSADLVHWELVNHAVKNVPGEQYALPRHSCGVWAPAIRFYRGLFYIYYGDPDQGIFCVTASDPEGEFSEPCLVMEGKGLIDPCPFFSEEGNYLVHAYAKSRCGFNSRLAVVELSDDGFAVKGEDKVIFCDEKNEKTIEGPKVYARDGFVYIWAPAGGVYSGWQTVLRGKSIYGPFEKKHVLEQGSTHFNGPHQGALVTTDTGTDWFLHFYPSKTHGRLLMLEPVKWEDGWPVTGNNGEPVSEHKRPYPEIHKSNYPDPSDSFKGGLKPYWQVPANRTREFYSCAQGVLRMESLYTGASLLNSPFILTQPFFFPEFTVNVLLNAEHLLPSESAGIAVIGSDYHGFGVTMGLDRNLQITEFYDSMYISCAKCEEKTVRLVVRVNVKGEFNIYVLSGKTKGKTIYAKTGDLNDMPFRLAAHHWVGERICLFSDTKVRSGAHGYAEFSDYTVTR